MPGSSWPRALVRAVLLVLVTLSMATPWVAHADPLEDGVRRVARQLQCPVCEGQNAADSPSGLAGDMRAVIRDKLAAGESDQQILDSFVASYGDSILTDPPKRGIGLGVWLGPTIGLVLGVLALLTLLRTWRRSPAARPAGANILDADVADEFHRFREEFGR